MARPDGVIESVDAFPVDIPLTDPFVISRGAVAVAQSAFVRVRLDTGVTGWGEAAPFGALTGETRAAAVQTMTDLAPAVTGHRAAEWLALATDMDRRAHGMPAARAALECAIVDALARERNLPLYDLWAAHGGTPDIRSRITDITLPILDESRVDTLAAGWYGRGFRIFKLKVGHDVDADRARVDRLAARYPDVRFILDANQAWDLDTGLRWLAGLRRASWHARVYMVEQPLARDDVEGMARMRAEAVVPIVADESVFTLADAHRVIAAKAADVVNLKLMKSGLSETLAIARAVRAAGLRLMIGGMMETRLAMGVSFSLVLGFGGIEHLDLDTPLLMAEDPLTGGFAYRGPWLDPWEGPGVGAVPAAMA